jgi:trigger factor
MHHAMPQPYKVIVELDDKEVKSALHEFWVSKGPTLMKETPGSWTKIAALREHLEKQEGHKLYWDMIWNWVEEGLKKVPLKIHRIIKISIDKFDEKLGAIISTEVDLIPSVKLGDYKNIKLQVPSFKPLPKEVEGQIILALNHSPLATTQELHQQIKPGDTVKMSYTISRADDNTVLQVSENDMINLSSGAYATEFVDAIVGEYAPSTFTKVIHFPDNYQHEILRGVDVNLKAEIFAVIKKILPTEEEEAAREGLSLEQWKLKFWTDIEKNKKESFEIRKRDFIRQGVEKHLLTTSEISPIPDSMIENETKALMENLARVKGMTVSEYAADMKMTEESLFAELAYLAVRRLMVRLIVEAICEAEGIVVDEKNTEEYLTKYAAEKGESLDKVKADVGDKDISFLVKSYLVDELLNNSVTLVHPTDG